MFGAFSRNSRVGFGFLFLLVVASAAVVGQTTTGQTSATEAASDSLGQSSAQTSSAVTAAASSPADQSSPGQSSSSVSSSTQSLADIARANQEKKATEGSTTPPRMITNADLPKNPDGYTGPPPDEQQRPAPNWSNSAREAAQQRAAEHASAQWRQQIVAQRNRVAMLETRIERLRAQIRFADPNAAGDYSAGSSYNGAQGTQIRILKDMEAELGYQRQRLEAMQDAARRAGMHTTVYDP